MWIKRETNLHTKDYIWDLKEKFSHEGFVIYDCLVEALANQPNGVIDISSRNYNIFLNNIEMFAISSKENVQKVIGFLIDQNIFTCNDNKLSFNSISETLVAIQTKKEKMSNAGKKGANNRWNKEKLQKELPQFEGEFSHVPDDIVIPNKKEITNESGHKFKRLLDVPKAKHKKIFEEHFTRFFEFIPEYTYIKGRNKQEQKAFLYLMNIISDGDIDVLYEDYIEDVICDSAEGNPDFYISNLYNKLVNEYIKIRNEARNDIKDEQAERFCEKYKLLKEMPEFYY